ncbi:MIT domain-containing protein 1-like [Orussus abietinus]|uniref:MIT domain-containing protein 1-like n=1 Tax=Orussus abietinus TaxID=222816 RepID=UPI0006253BC1|nr:MIT domain-containing protein 1-like [Orussus abietinus]
MESAAASILQRAVDMDKKERYTMALVLYQEGLQILLDSVKEEKNPSKREHFKEKALQYMDRAERIKAIIDQRKSVGKYREVMEIEDGSTGHGYVSIFGRFLDHMVTDIIIEDPYVRAFHQCQNLVRLCELAVQKCRSLSRISLVTTCDPQDQQNQSERLNQLKRSLETRLVQFDVTYDSALHDRRIRLSNGWVIKIGRGLDYFKAPQGKCVLGVFDLELRPCLATTVDVFHESHVRQTFET